MWFLLCHVVVCLVSSQGRSYIFEFDSYSGLNICRDFVSKFLTVCFRACSLFMGWIIIVLLVCVLFIVKWFVRYYCFVYSNCLLCGFVDLRVILGTEFWVRLPCRGWVERNIKFVCGLDLPCCSVLSVRNIVLWIYGVQVWNLKCLCFSFCWHLLVDYKSTCLLLLGRRKVFAVLLPVHRFTFYFFCWFICQSYVWRLCWFRWLILIMCFLAPCK